MGGYGFNLDEEEEDLPANYVEMPAEEEADPFASLDAPRGPPPDVSGPPPRPGSSFDGSRSLARAHDRDNSASVTGELVNNITNAFTRKPVQGKDRTELFAKQRAEMVSEEGRARTAAEADPHSDASRQYRELVRQAMPEVADGMGPQFERLTPKYGATALPFMKEAWARKQRAATLEASARAAEAKRTQELADRADQRKFDLGRDDRRHQNNLDAAGITANRSASIRADDRAADAASRESEERRKATVRGLDLAPGGAPSVKKAEKMEEAMIAARRMKALTKELRELHSGVDGVGTELTGPQAARMAQLYGAMITEGKNIAALGALSGPDMGLVQSIIGLDPTSLQANLKALIGSDNTAGALDGVDRWVDNSEKAARDVFGYLLPGQGQKNGAGLPSGWSAADEKRLQELQASGGAQ